MSLDCDNAINVNWWRIGVSSNPVMGGNGHLVSGLCLIEVNKG